MGDNLWDSTFMYLQQNLSPFFLYVLCCLNYYSYFLVPQKIAQVNNVLLYQLYFYFLRQSLRIPSPDPRHSQNDHLWKKQ
jgi:hypothetical protein